MRILKPVKAGKGTILFRSFFFLQSHTIRPAINYCKENFCIELDKDCVNLLLKRNERWDGGINIRGLRTHGSYFTRMYNYMHPTKTINLFIVLQR